MYQDFENNDSAIEEALADERLNSIDIDYLIEQIDDQLNNLLSSGNKKNFLKSFEKQLETISRIETETDVESIKESVYNLIVQNICDKFNISIDLDDVNIKKVAKQFYKFFVLNYIDNLSFFIQSYILENREEILNDLKHMDHINAKKIPEINGDISIIMNNLAEVIYIINSKHIEFNDFLYYLGKHPESSSCVEEMREYLNDIIEDEGSVVDKLLEPLVMEEEDFGEIYINIQLELYNNFNEDSDEDE